MGVIGHFWRPLQDMLLKRAADIAEALYSVPRPHSQLQALPGSPAHGSVMGLGSYPSQLGVSIGEPAQATQGKRLLQMECTHSADHSRCFWNVLQLLHRYNIGKFKQLTRKAALRLV